jgi:hypothetical protein
MVRRLYFPRRAALMTLASSYRAIATAWRAIRRRGSKSSSDLRLAGRENAVQKPLSHIYSKSISHFRFSSCKFLFRSFCLVCVENPAPLCWYKVTQILHPIMACRTSTNFSYWLWSWILRLCGMRWIWGGGKSATRTHRGSEIVTPPRLDKRGKMTAQPSKQLKAEDNENTNKSHDIATNRWAACLAYTISL